LRAPRWTMGKREPQIRCGRWVSFSIRLSLLVLPLFGATYRARVKTSASTTAAWAPTHPGLDL